MPYSYSQRVSASWPSFYHEHFALSPVCARILVITHVLEFQRPQHPRTEDWLARGSAFRLYRLQNMKYQIDRRHADTGWETTYLDSEEAAVRTLRRYLRLACEGDESIEFSSRGLKLLGLDRDADELQLPRRAR
jgi:hypothetical protein